MKMFIMTSLLCASVASFADEKVPVKEGFQTMNMESMPQVGMPNPGNKISFSKTCTDVAGTVFSQGQNGFDACLAQLKLKAMQNGNKPGEAPGTQMNMNYKFGN